MRNARQKIWMAGLIIPSIAVGVLLGTRAKVSTAAPAAAFNQVTPFVTSGGFLGFFDQPSGKIYLYDRELKNCVSVFQLQNLGDPIDVVRTASSKETAGDGVTY